MSTLQPVSDVDMYILHSIDSRRKSGKDTADESSGDLRRQRTSKASSAVDAKMWNWLKTGEIENLILFNTIERKHSGGVWQLNIQEWTKEKTAVCPAIFATACKHWWRVKADNLQCYYAIFFLIRNTVHWHWLTFKTLNDCT